MTPDEIRGAVERTVVDTLRSIHHDGTGCGTNGTGGCSVCYGPSPLDATEIAEHLVPAIVGVVAPALKAAQAKADMWHKMAVGNLRAVEFTEAERDEARAALEVAESWRDRNAESAERFREQRDAALAENERLRELLTGRADIAVIRAALDGEPADKEET